MDARSSIRRLPARFRGFGGLSELEIGAIIVVAALASAVSALANLHGSALGFDFRGNEWEPARAVLHGRSPYAHLTEGYLRSHSSTFVLPPLVAFLAVPLGALPFNLAFGIWTALSLAAFIGALRLMGLRNRNCYLLACLSFPLVSNLLLGQMSAFLALGCAAVWRYRDRRYAPGLIVAAMIVLKLLAWPLLLWLLFTGRRRAAAAGLLASVALAAASWAALGFEGLRGFPHALALDGRLFGLRTHSIVAAVGTLGLSERAGQAAAALVALALLAWGFRRASTRHDLAAFAAAVAAGIYASPVVHPHYLLLMVVVLAAAHPRPTWAWLVLPLFWLSPVEPPASPVLLDLTVAIALAIVLSLVLVDDQAAVTQGAAARPSARPGRREAAGDRRLIRASD